MAVTVFALPFLILMQTTAELVFVCLLLPWEISLDGNIILTPDIMDLKIASEKRREDYSAKVTVKTKRWKLKHE